MIRAGVIRNPNSQRNKADPLREKALPAGVTVATPHGHEALAATLVAFAADGVRHLLIDGGDGTLRDVMAALPAAYGRDWPTMALCASGNTNLAAGDVGSFSRSDQAVAQWYATLTGAAASRVSERRPVEVRWPDGSQPPVFGFFLGCANFSRGVEMATGAVRDKGFLHGWAVTATIIGAVWQMLAGGVDNDWQQGSRLTLGIDDRPALEAPRFVVLVTSLQRLLLLKVWPFWSGPAESGPLHWLDIRAPAPRFGRALASILRGKPKAWMLASGAYHSGRATQMTLTMDECLIIDGEPFAPDGKGQLELRAGPKVMFRAPV